MAAKKSVRKSKPIGKSKQLRSPPAKEYMTQSKHMPSSPPTKEDAVSHRIEKQEARVRGIRSASGKKPKTHR